MSFPSDLPCPPRLRLALVFHCVGFSPAFCSLLLSFLCSVSCQQLSLWLQQSSSQDKALLLPLLLLLLLLHMHRLSNKSKAWVWRGPGTDGEQRSPLSFAATHRKVQIACYFKNLMPHGSSTIKTSGFKHRHMLLWPCHHLYLHVFCHESLTNSTWSDLCRQMSLNILKVFSVFCSDYSQQHVLNYIFKLK